MLRCSWENIWSRLRGLWRMRRVTSRGWRSCRRNWGRWTSLMRLIGSRCSIISLRMSRSWYWRYRTARIYRVRRGRLYSNCNCRNDCLYTSWRGFRSLTLISSSHRAKSTLAKQGRRSLVCPSWRVKPWGIISWVSIWFSSFFRPQDWSAEVTRCWCYSRCFWSWTFPWTSSCTWPMDWITASLFLPSLSASVDWSLWYHKRCSCCGLGSASHLVLFWSVAF